ncbi:MAG: M28 family peptidase [Gemmatimonadaceae bacterium]|nr:M28 family peptidase [Gemmatimonadaceae bacterium]
MNRVTLAGALALCAAAPLAAQNQTKAMRVQKGASSPKTVWPDEGPKTWAPRPTSTDISANDLRTRLYAFADDSMQGRRIGELGNYKGTEYIAKEFKRLGLKPAGDSGTYFQVLPFGPLGFDQANSSLKIAGKPVAPTADWVPATPTAGNGFGGSANLDNVQTVFGGRWGDTTVTLDPAAVKGKVVVFIGHPSATGGGAGRGPASFVSCGDVPNKFGAAAAADVEAKARTSPAAPAAGRGGGGGAQNSTLRDLRAERAGAAAVLIIGLEDMTAAARSTAFTGRMTMQPASTPSTGTVPSATISRAAATQLFGTQIDQIAVGTTGQPVSAQWNYAWRMSPYPARNVVAVLPGSDPTRAAEYVLVGAHNDHVGVNSAVVDHDSLRAVNTVTRRQGANDPACTPTAEQQKKIDSLIAHARKIRAPRLDSIMNGADDDGSGSMVMLEIAERFAAEKPARSIIFVSHQGEEAGLLGSRWFVDHPTIPLSQVVAAHNMDMLGKGRADQVKFGGPSSVQMLGSRRLSREFGDIIDSVNAVRAETMAIDKSWDVTANPMNRFCRSDQVNYVNKDIPVTYFSLGYAQDYHQPTDEPQYIEYDHAARLGRFIHDIMMAIAQRKDRPAIAGPDPSYPSCRR